MGIDDDLQRLEEKLAETPVNKATETERARLKSQIAKLKEEKQQRQKETGGGYEGYSVKKTGDATVALVGPPSVGKSTFLNAVTNADSETGDYEFTTLDVVPGMLQWRGANIQLVDVPGLIGGAAEGRGRGQEVLSVIRNADAIMMMTSPEKIDGFVRMEDELYDAGIRLNVSPPDVSVTKQEKGGLSIATPVDQSHLDVDTIEEVLRDRGYVNARVVIREDLTLDRLVDALAPNREYMPGIKVLNKADTLSADERDSITADHPDVTIISAADGTSLDAAKDAIYDALRFMRIYMKKPGKDPDRDEPLIVQRDSTVMDVVEQLQGMDPDRFAHARVWGDSAKFPEQQVGADHTLRDEDILELHMD